MMAGKPQKHFTLEQLRAAQRESAMKWYNDPKNKEKRKQSMKNYYERKKAEKLAETEADD